jgi:hypothetical protein
MAVIQVITSDKDKAKDLQQLLEKAKHSAEVGPMTEPLRKRLLQSPPDAIVIDLERAPATGRDLGLFLRTKIATRHSILVYLDGKAEKVTAIRELLPDAIYTNIEAIVHDLASGLANPPTEPHVPDSVFAGYAGRPLAAKLGIKEGMLIALVNAPDSIESKLEPLPDQVVLQHGLADPPHVALWFARQRSDLETRLQMILDQVHDSKLWILWPKASSGVQSDLTQAVVRRYGLDAGWVDFKVCSFDQTWSGLCFTARKP